MAQSRDIPPSHRPSTATRLLAPAALVAVTIVVILVISASLGGGGSGSSGKRAGGRGKGNPTTTTTKGRKPPKHYAVEPGDSLSAIADRYGISVETIIELNPDVDPQALVTGQKLKLR